MVPVVGHQIFQVVAVVGQQPLEITTMHQPMLGTVEMAPLPVFLARLLLMREAEAQEAIIPLLVLAAQAEEEEAQTALVIPLYLEPLILAVVAVADTAQTIQVVQAAPVS